MLFECPQCKLRTMHARSVHVGWGESPPRAPRTLMTGNECMQHPVPDVCSDEARWVRMQERPQEPGWLSYLWLHT